jgi:sRNA-binding regulator protein Hfq
LSSLVVDKIKKKVTFLMADGVQMTGHIFLSPHSEKGVGRETTYDALTGDTRFIPFESTGGDFCFVNQTCIVWLAHLPDEDEAEAIRPIEQRSVIVHLIDGKRLRGDIVMAMPEERSRISDWLNEVEHFLTLRDEKKEVLINLKYILRVM